MRTQSLSRRAFLNLAAMTAAGAALAACAAPVAPQAAGGESAAAPANEPVTIDIWEQQVSVDAATGAAKAFAEKNPNIKLNWVPTPLADTTTKLVAAIAAGNGEPDLAFIQYNDRHDHLSLARRHRHHRHERVDGRPQG